MRSRAPRQTAHRGSVEASGVFLAPGPTGGEASMRERALSLWHPGAAVHRVAGGLVVLFAAPRRMSTRASPGAPLVRQGDVLGSAPLEKDELEPLAAPRGGVVLVRGGEAQVHALGSETLEEPARWLDLAAFEPSRVRGLGSPPPPVAESMQPMKVELRERLSGAVPPAAPGAAMALEALRNADGAAAAGEEEGGSGGWRALAGRVLRALARLFSGGRGAGEREQQQVRRRAAGTAAKDVRVVEGGSGRRGFVRRVLEAVSRLFSRGGSPGQRQVRGGRDMATEVVERSKAPGTAGRPRAPREPTWRSRVADWLHRAAERMALASGLARVLGARQAEYLGRMMRYFEEGNLDQALRHAIPLHEGSGEARAALGVPKPRENLDIPLERRGAGAAIGVGGALMETLRDLYRRTFNKLAREGQIERAAFVLAELLGAVEEAVAFLEKHGQLRLAAELAESRDLPPGLVVRQWFLAGDLERALLVARRTGAFADALVRLRRTHPDQAASFALLWADALAEAGDYWKASDVAWGLPGAMRLVMGWLDKAIEVGGPTGARALVRRLSADADAFDALRPRALAVLGAPLEEDGGARRAFAEELASVGLDSREDVLSPPLAVLARGAVRALARDAGDGVASIDRRQLERLARLTGEPVLEADLPVLPPVRGPREEMLSHRAGAPGQQRIHDAALLSGGRVLLAYGESGAELCTPDGRRIHFFDVPAHSLVVSDHGDRAITLAPRGEQKLLSRIDLRAGRAERWCEAPLRAFAKDYDGDVWFASEVGAMLALDARAPDARALWRLPQIPGGVLGIARRAGHCHFLVQSEGTAQRWSLELPSYTLRARTDIPAREADRSMLAVGVDGSVVCVDHDLVSALSAGPGEPIEQRLRVFRTKDDHREVKFLSPVITWPPTAAAEWSAMVRPLPGALVVMVVRNDRLKRAVEVELPLARLAAVRFSGQRAVIADDLGRAVVLDLERGCVTRELRR